MTGTMTKMLNPLRPAQSIGGLGLFGNKVSKGLGPVSEWLSSGYLSGWPHVTGSAPIFGSHTNRIVDNITKRAINSKDDRD